jgi:hypothetical protein
MGGQKLANIEDIGVTIADNLKLSTQSAKATKKVQTDLGQISRAFHYRLWI